MSTFAAATWDNYNLSANCGPDKGKGELVATCLANLPSPGNFSLDLSGWSSSPDIDTGGENKFTAAKIYDWGEKAMEGLGIVGTGENKDKDGTDGFDNAYGVDAMLFRFGDRTKLTSLQIGLNATVKTLTDGSIDTTFLGSDVSIFAWVEASGTIYPNTSGPVMTAVGPGTPDPTTSLPSAPDGTLTVNPTSAGWYLVGNYFGVGAYSNSTIVTNTNITSSYWLVSAYDQRYGEDNTEMTKNIDYDSFRLLKLSAHSCTTGDNSCSPPQPTPEPGSMALMGAAFLGMVVARRRYHRSAD